MKTLTLLQRAFLLGYRRGFPRARAEYRAMAHVFDDRLEELQSDYQDVIRQIRSEKLRYDAIEQALNTERDPDDPWLN